MSATKFAPFEGTASTISGEKWFKHITWKLSRGYDLLVRSDREIANFYRGYGDYEPCSYKMARQMIKAGYLVEKGEEENGTYYGLVEELVEAPSKKKTAKKEKPKPVAKKVDEDELLDDDLEDLDGEEGLEDDDDLLADDVNVDLDEDDDL